MKEICPIEQCTGCTACVNICGKSAITMVPDKLGFYYPSVNEEQCVNCGLCELSCPNNHPVTKVYPQHALVGHATDATEQLTSTSGGVASVLSRWCLRQGGIVYGCSAKECTHVQHIRVTQEEELEWLKGSKYVQSDMGSIYTQVRKDLRDGRLVLFIGTPCQCAGLKSFLHKDYDKLYTIDFVCHGVPSQLVLNEELKLHATEEQLHSARLSFRRKVKKCNKYVTQYGIFLTQDSGTKLYGETFPENPYITGFLSALFYRNSCYQCHYTTPERVSDITLGDYGDHDGEYESFEGKKRLLSMLAINTKEGAKLVADLHSELFLKNIDYRKLVSSQGQLQRPMIRHIHRDEFETRVKHSSYKQVVDSLLADDKRRIYRNKWINNVRNILYSVPLLKQ